MERKDYIGGTDWQHILNIPPYGCRRKAFYEKSGQQPDYPQEMRAVMERGLILEPIVAQLYEKATNHKVRIMTKFSRKTNLPEWWGGHVDRIIESATTGGKGTGILECKTLGMGAFKQLRTQGVSEAYLAQMMHYFALTGFSWGDFAILWPDAWELLVIPVLRVDTLIEKMRIEGQKFWDEVQKGIEPPRLEVEDRRCARCEYRKTCQGEFFAELAEAAENKNKVIVPVHDKELEIAAREYLAVSTELAELEDIKTALRSKIKNRLETLNVAHAQVAGAVIHASSFEQERFDVKSFRAKHPELAREFLKVSQITQIRVYPL